MYVHNNTEEGATLDIKVQNFWDKSKQPSLMSESSTLMHKQTVRPPLILANEDMHEREKRRAYEQCVLVVEHGTFTPLVLSTSGDEVRLLRLHSRDL